MNTKFCKFPNVLHINIIIFFINQQIFGGSHLCNKNVLNFVYKELSSGSKYASYFISNILFSLFIAKVA